VASALSYEERLRPSILNGLWLGLYLLEQLRA
jgi:hypothetical protein